jgi:hypothetical protein
MAAKSTIQKVPQMAHVEKKINFTAEYIYRIQTFFGYISGKVLSIDIFSI